MDELINEQDAIPVVIDRWAIDTVGLEEEILCEMCENPMRTDRGCDGLCSYDKDLYKRIIKVLNDRMKPLQPDVPEMNVGKWIPVSERLPEEGQGCLVCDKGHILIDTFIGHGNPYNWKFYVRDYEAWMPLPEPYKEGEENG